MIYSIIQWIIHKDFQFFILLVFFTLYSFYSLLSSLISMLAFFELLPNIFYYHDRYLHELGFNQESNRYHYLFGNHFKVQEICQIQDFIIF